MLFANAAGYRARMCVTGTSEVISSCWREA